MKLLLRLLILTLIISCNNTPSSEKSSNSPIEPLENNDQNGKQINDLLNSIKDKPQIFILPSNKPSVVKGQNGMKVFLEPNDLETEDGESISGDISLELIEATKTRDLITNNTPTTSNGKLLVTGGAYFVQASSNGKKLKLKDGKTLKIDLPRLSENEMELFLGERKSNGSINWVSVNQNLTKDTTPKPTKPIEKGVTKYYKKTSTNEDAIDAIMDYVDGKDSSPVKSERVEVSKEEYEKYLIEKAEYERKLKVWQEEQNTYSQIELKTFGWINCDRFLQNDIQKTNLIVKFQNDTINQVKTILVFKDIKSVMETVANKEKDFFKATIENIPKDNEATLISIGMKNEKCFYNEQDIVIGQQSELTVSLLEIPKGELKNKLNRFK
jgi:hypothetical protein